MTDRPSVVPAPYPGGEALVAAEKAVSTSTVVSPPPTRNTSLRVVPSTIRAKVGVLVPNPIVLRVTLGAETSVVRISSGRTFQAMLSWEGSPPGKVRQ